MEYRHETIEYERDSGILRLLKKENLDENEMLVRLNRQFFSSDQSKILSTNGFIISNGGMNSEIITASCSQELSGPHIFFPAYILTGGEGFELCITVAGMKCFEAIDPISLSFNESMIKRPAMELINPTVGNAITSIEFERSIFLYSKIVMSSIFIKTQYFLHT
ncbi:unnamed protein product [marine sediment metagenome]|uniref:Uncharacterized protein n=1 Tax=marine sediment metagenome TaxID=412755 RepID=X1B875_9ZZZZ